MHGRRRAREIVDLVDFNIERKRHVVAQDLEPRGVEQMQDIVSPSGEVIVDRKHVVPLGEKPLAEVRA
jgi:hypothetical protein